MLEMLERANVPFRNLIDYLEGGYSLEEFLDAFPSVTREQAIAALEAAHEALSGREAMTLANPGEIVHVDH